LSTGPPLEVPEAAQYLEPRVVQISDLVTKDVLKDNGIYPDAVHISQRNTRSCSFRAIQYSKFSETDPRLDDSNCILIHELLIILIPSLDGNSDVSLDIKIYSLG